MTMNPSRKLLEVFVSIIPQVIRILHISKWEPRRGVTVRILVLIIPQIIRIHFSELEEFPKK